MGGLYLFYLKLMRGERPNLEIVFSGFSHRLVQLFLGNLVATLLVTLGLICLILPGIYLSTAWLFTLVLIIDKGIDFWPAMELSRKVITRHWWKFFGFAVVLLLLKSLGVLFCIIGVFITGPIVHAALLYAYEDILGSRGPAKGSPGVTVPAPAPQSSIGTGRGIALGLAVVVILVSLAAGALLLVRYNHQIVQEPEKTHQYAVNKRVTDFPESPDFSTPESTYAAWARAAARQDAFALNEMQLDRPGLSRYLDWFRREQERDTVGTTVYRDAKILNVQTWRDNLANVIAEVPHPPSAHLGRYSSLTLCRTNGMWKEVGDQLWLDLKTAKNSFEDTKDLYWRLYAEKAVNGNIGIRDIDAGPSGQPGEKARAIVRINRFRAVVPSSPSVDYSATVPAGYALEATATSEGSVHTMQMDPGARTYYALWHFPLIKHPFITAADMKSGHLFVPPPPNFDTAEQREAERKLMEDQLQQLLEQGPIVIGLGQPKMLFSVTNAAGDVWQGFLKLAEAPTNGIAGNEFPAATIPELPAPPPTLPLPLSGAIRPTRTLRTNPFSAAPWLTNGQSLTPEEQVALIEIQRMHTEQEKSGQWPRAKTLLSDEVAAKIDPATGLPVAGQTPNMPTIDPATGLPAANAPESETILFAEQPSVVVETFPTSGARDVAPGDTEIRVRFSKPMEDGSWSWSSAFENSTPESVDAPHYLEDGCTCVMKVRLSPGRTYAWWLNSDKFHNFKDRAGRPAVPYLLIFQTKPNGN